MVDRVQLQGKTVVVTGATTGVGRGVAWEVARAGASVVVAARRRHELEELVARIAAAGGTALAVPTDVSDRAAVDRLASAAASRFGGIDVWVNNVGIGAVGPFWEVPVDDHARVIDVNVNGMIYGAHAALRQFRAQVGGGVLINLGSVESVAPLAYQASYAASKAAVTAFGRTLRQELLLSGDHRRIQVSTILPWALDTPFWNRSANRTGHSLRMAAMSSPRPVVDAIVRACVRPRPWRPVGAKARLALFAARLAPGAVDRMSARIVGIETPLGEPAPHTPGAIHEPTVTRATVTGGVRARMRRENRSGLLRLLGM
ncbi:NAD(P)-dependent dehydrogenase (short-subunit alcohol dehydrogenase family) [Microbacterium sp. AK009]|uniref:SDR family NAD(P)-dependent oxidoreductase n=1 Tax=Microbacterium sp. AK009 TaxID=2723068 RepID=UPI0015C8C44C|nr:SDR family NAD(P)-dependent oxidoreductase [Microbacterium sp. AK009]NYF16662.1 NAD(P)-dependent dehydrogenase (short-subunit alcohol dehydrogenase family) [Microbacterium sp. AK009]